MRSTFKLSLLLLLAGLTVAAVGTFLRLDAEKRQSAIRTTAAPKTGRYLSAGDCEIFVQEQGPRGADDLVMLFVGGTGAWSESWKEWAKLAAARGFHAVAMDLPPFGYSTKPTGSYSRGEQADRIVKLVESLHARTLVIIAHSFGAAPAFTAAARMPEKVASMLVIAPALGFTEGIPESPSIITKFLLGSDFTRFAIASLATHPKLQRNLLQRVLYRKESATDEVVEVYARQMNVQGKSEEMSAWLSQFLLVPDPIPDSFFKSVAAYVTIFAGDHDNITPPWQAEKLAKLLKPPTTLSVLKEVGHVPQLEDPDQFRAAYLAYLTGLRELMAPLEPVEP